MIESSVKPMMRCSRMHQSLGGQLSKDGWVCAGTERAISRSRSGQGERALLRVLAQKHRARWRGQTPRVKCSAGRVPELSRTQLSNYSYTEIFVYSEPCSKFPKKVTAARILLLGLVCVDSKASTITDRVSQPLRLHALRNCLCSPIERHLKQEALTC